MPAEASLAKVAAVKGFGGTVRLGGDSVDACVASARERAAETGATFVHPFDDPEIVAGQGTLGLELLDDVADIATVIVPVGGGGLISGVAGVLKAARPRRPRDRRPGRELRGLCHLAGARRAGRGRRRRRRSPTGSRSSVLAGSCCRSCRRGSTSSSSSARTTSPRRWCVLLERAKLVVEGAGAVGVAALLAGTIVPAARGATVVLLSGGNVDAGVLATVALRHETAEGRRLRFFTRVEDRPGGLARLLTCVAQAGGNLVTVTHVREAVPLLVRQTGVDLVLETRGAEHATEFVNALEQAGYGIERLADGAAGPRPPGQATGSSLADHGTAVTDATEDARARAAFALAELLRRPRFEVIPLEGIEEQVRAHLGTDVKVTVTASPRKGLEATLGLSERLARAGYPVVPAPVCAAGARSLASARDRGAAARGGRARAVRPRRRCRRARRVRRCRRAVAGDGTAARAFDEIGITGYPETHHLISDEETIQAMFAKAPMATCIISQICFDAAVIGGWIARSGGAARRCRSGSGCPGRSTTRSSSGPRCRSVSANPPASCAITRTGCRA